MAVFAIGPPREDIGGYGGSPPRELTVPVPEGMQERLGADRLAAGPADRVHRVVVQVEQVGVAPVSRPGPERARFRFWRVRSPLHRKSLLHGPPRVDPKGIFARFPGEHPKSATDLAVNLYVHCP